MESSDDENDTVPRSVTNFYFENDNEVPISFSELPLKFGEKGSVKGDTNRIFLRGDSGDGLQKLYKEVTAWKYDISKAKPEISVLAKGNIWIKLDNPRKSYEKIIQSIMITVFCIHYLKNNPEVSRKALWDHLSKVFSLYEPKPSQNDLIDHMDLISEAVKREKALSKSKFLVTFMEEKPKKKKVSEEDFSNADNFIVDDTIIETEDDAAAEDSDDESGGVRDLFDPVCSICDNGGNVLCCDGKCLRSFHPDKAAGKESNCRSLGFSAAEVEALQSYLCPNCEHNQHQCYACGQLGSSDKSSGAEVFRCSSATCGHFFHPLCAANILCKDSEAEAEQLGQKIASGEPFMCPSHKCFKCNHGENENVKELQFATCRRCPRVYHRKCLPKKIASECSDDEDDAIQRAWEDLLPKSRILIYCLDHEIDYELETPKRNHLRFPLIGQRNEEEPEQLPSKKKAVVKGGELHKDRPSEKKYAAKPQKGTKMSSAVERAESSKKRTGTFSHSESFKKPKLADSLQKPLKRSLSSKTIKQPTRDISQPSLGSKLYALMNMGSEEVASKNDDTAVGEQPAKSRARKVITYSLDSDSKKRIDALVKDAFSNLTVEEMIKKQNLPPIHKSSSKYVVNKNINLGKVEGSVEAIRLALKKLEEGGSMEDAKAVCEPEIVYQLASWKNKLKVYLGPFLHGTRYTSYGRHFTKLDKLQEVVNRLHWYVEEGDTIVDFCCGANDFSRLMKEKLDEVGKSCFYKNYDKILTKNDFNFEKRDWMTVSPKELPPGSQLIMGLNPPFGVQAALANQFVYKALKFKPKIIILIVPPETERLDKKDPYDLIWEDDELLAGKAFYLPGSVDVNDVQVEQWNNTAPPLYLWSRRDFTSKHKSIAQQQGHSTKARGVSFSDGNCSFSSSPLEENHMTLKINQSTAEEEELPQLPKKADVSASLAERNKDNSSLGNEGTRGNAGEVRGKDGPKGNSKKRNRGKGKRKGGQGRVSPPEKQPPERESSVEEKQKLPSPAPQQSPAPQIPSLADIANERASQRFDHLVSGSHMKYDGMTRKDDLAQIYSTSTEGLPYTSTSYGRMDVTAVDPGYGFRNQDVHFPGYHKESLSYPVRYGMESDGRAPLTSAGDYLPGHEPGFPTSYGLRGTAADPMYNRTNTSAMQRYAPRLDELNHTRMNSLGAEQSMANRSGIYDPAMGSGPGYRADPSGFVPGSYRPYPQQHNSSGWLNE